MTNEANDFLMSAGVPAAKFPTVGTTVKGVILSAEVRDQTDMQTGAVLTFPDGNPRKQLVITLETDERDESNDLDDGMRRVFAKAEMLKAIRDVARPYRGILPGGKLAIKYTGDKQPTQRGFNPAKLYRAWYEPPSAPTIAIPDDGELGDDGDVSPF